MPAFDQCHDQVVRALQKEGWTLESSPHKLSLPPRVVYVDLQMSRRTNGTREHMMLVEVKCFPDEASTTHDLYSSIGQYLVYRAMIQELELPFSLYLAVPETIFELVFDQPIMRVIQESDIRIVVINLGREEVVKWIR
ncbi:MAG: hypothetical protein HZC41_05755 [Chloroflexi bacterium]|nr:hypothetical protein [Chloroflexota bacterium]